MSQRQGAGAGKAHVRTPDAGKAQLPSQAAGKAQLRSAARGRRDAMSPTMRAAASQAIAARFMRHWLAGAAPLAPAAGGDVPVISAYWPIRSEVDPMPLLQALAAHGVATSLPVVAHPTLIFRLWRPGDPLQDAGFGTFGPTEAAPECAPSLVLTPCLAFDRAGGRLGYGAGHFDRALEQLRRAGALQVAALAFADQEVAHTHQEAHDQPLDAIVTEREFITPGGDV